MDIVTKFSCDAFRYYFLRECPFPSYGEFGWLGLRRCSTATWQTTSATFTAGWSRSSRRTSKGCWRTAGGPRRRSRGTTRPGPSRPWRGHVEACRYHQVLETIWRQVLDPANRFADSLCGVLWKLLKTDMPAAGEVLFGMLEPLRAACILLKPFLPCSAQTIYSSFNFAKPWDDVNYEDAASLAKFAEDLKVLATLEAGKVKPLFPRIG